MADTAAVCNQKPIIDQINSYFSGFGTLFNNFFNNKNPKLNATLVLQKIKEKKIDPEKLKNFLDSMPNDRWSVEFLLNKSDELNALFGLSESEIAKHCITEVSKTDMKSIKWELQKMSLQESAKYANEYYDAFKYNQNEKLSINKMKLVNELMLTFKLIKENSNKISNQYENAKANDRIIRKFNLMAFPLELLWLRILFVMFKLQNATNQDIDKLTRILSMERISIGYQKIYKKY
jgi:hypothetical protein